MLLGRYQHVAMDLLLHCFHPRPPIFWGWDLWNQSGLGKRPFLSSSSFPLLCFPFSSFLCFHEARSHTVAHANLEVPATCQPKIGITGMQPPRSPESYWFLLSLQGSAYKWRFGCLCQHVNQIMKACMQSVPTVLQMDLNIIADDIVLQSRTWIQTI